MQSRRRFFCSRVELVQLARAFLYPSTGHAGNDGQRRTGGHSRPGCTEPRNRARVQGHRQAPKQATEPPTAAHRGKQSTAPETYTAGNTIYSPTEPRRAGVLSLYYHSRKRRTGAHRAAHRGQAAGGIETPGRASPQPPQPRHSTPGKNPGDFL